jgi:hypothetical protein
MRSFITCTLHQYYYGDQLEDEMGGAFGTYESDEKHNISVGKTEGKRLLGIPRRRWEDNIRMDLKEIGWEVVDWIHLAYDRG